MKIVFWPLKISKKNYLRIICLDSPGVIGKIGDLFGKNDVSIESIVQLDASENKAEIVVITHEVSNGNFEKSEIKWINIDELHKYRRTFRIFYKSIVYEIIKYKKDIKSYLKT